MTTAHAAIARLATLAIAHDATLPDLVREALALLVHHVPCASCAIAMVDGDTLVIRAASDPEAEGTRHPMAGSLIELAIEAGGLVTTRLGGDDDPTSVLATPGAPVAAWAVPLRFFNRERVLVGVGLPDTDVSPAGVSTIEAVADILTGAAQQRALEVELRSTRDLFRRLAEHSPDAAFQMRILPARCMEYVNPRFVELTGLSEAELLADPFAWRRLVPHEDRSALELAEYLDDGEVVTTAPYRIVRDDGTTRWLETRIAPQLDVDGQLVAVTGTSRDITVRRRADAALRRTLEREQEAAEQLRALGELKSALLAAVSHELRTPLTAVIGFAEVLRASGDSLEPARRDRALAALERNALRLERLLVDLLDLDRLDRGVVDPVRRPVDVAALVTAIVDGLAPTSVPVTIDSEPRVMRLDGPKIERVVENLVVNAIKHAPDSSQVWIRTRDADGGLVLSVEDDGPGVPDELKPLVFEPFERGLGSDSPVPGTGIGLSLVRRFVELHGGRAWVEDRDGGGARFAVWLPDA